MSALRTTVRWLMRAAIAIVAVPVVLYLCALAVNWRDQPPNTEALALASPSDETVPDSVNGYVYVLGLGAPRDADPAAIGAERAAWLRRLPPNSERPFISDPHPDSADESERKEPFSGIGMACSDFRNADCVAAIEAATTALPGALAEQRWQIDRYLALLNYRAWHEIASADPRAPLLAGLHGYPRWLFFLDTWLLAAAGDARQVSARLDADLVLWRMALAESDSLVGKEIAARRISEHFDWGNLILRRLPPERRADGVPAAWRKPLTDMERSMRRVFVGEWRHTNDALQSMKTRGPDVQNSLSWYDRFNAAIALPLLQPQASANRDAAVLVKLDALLNVPYPEFKAALARAPELDLRESGVLAVTYNLVGRALMGTDRAAYLADYAARVADLEGARRAALLAADLRGLRIPAELAGAMIPLAAVRDPYTGGPYGWTADPATVTFTGLERTTRAQHSFLY